MVTLGVKSRQDIQSTPLLGARAVMGQQNLQPQPAVQSMLCALQPGRGSVPVVQKHEERFGRCASCRVVRTQPKHVLQRHHCASILECSLHIGNNGFVFLAHTSPFGVMHWSACASG